MKKNIVPPFNQSQLESIARILGNTEKGLTGSEIAHLLGSSKIPDCDSSNTKWKRIYNAFAEFQNKNQIGNNICKFITLSMAPECYIDNSEQFKMLQEKLNKVLSFSGLELQEDGKLHRTTKTKTLSEAISRAARFKTRLEQRNVHEDVTVFANAEIIADNYFHAVLEAMKSITAKIRDKTGYYADGADLVNAIFMGSSPVLVINDYKTKTQIGEQKGFANLLIGLYGTFRNPTAHEPKIEWEMTEQDALDIMTTISLVHRKLDKAQKY
jgi:uncharacterized protein (TIGR02391 family)